MNPIKNMVLSCTLLICTSLALLTFTPPAPAGQNFQHEQLFQSNNQVISTNASSTNGTLCAMIGGGEVLALNTSLYGVGTNGVPITWSFYGALDSKGYLWETVPFTNISTPVSPGAWTNSIIKWATGTTGIRKFVKAQLAIPMDTTNTVLTSNCSLTLPNY